MQLVPNAIHSNYIIIIHCNSSPDAPRANCIEWEEYFMGLAFFARQRSKDPAYQVGAVIVNDYKQVLGIGLVRFVK